MSKMRLIQIGTGGFGKYWLESVLGMEEVEVAAIVDVNRDNLAEAEKIAYGHNVRSFSDHRQAFQEVQADIVLLITPPDTHHKLMVDAVEAGMHVIIEKPVASDWNQAVKIAEYARTCGKLVMVNQNYRWSTEIQAVKEAVQAGKVGMIENVEWRFARNHTLVNFRTGWRSEFDEILIKEMSIHHFDLLRYLLGKNPLSVYAESVNPSWSQVPSNATASAIIHFEGNILVQYFASWVSRGKDTPWNGNIRLTGPQGVIELTDDIPYVIHLNGEREELPLPEMTYSGVQYSIFEMVNAIRENRLPATHIDDNLISWNLASMAVESANTGVRKSCFRS